VRFKSVGRMAGAVGPRFRRFSVYPDSLVTIEHPAAVGQEIEKPIGLTKTINSANTVACSSRFRVRVLCRFMSVCWLADDIEATRMIVERCFVFYG